MDDGKKLASYEELSADAKQTLGGYAGLEGVDPSTYIALAFRTPGADGRGVLVVHTAPLRVELYSAEGQLQVSLNERALLHFETSSAGTPGAAAVAEHASAAASEKDRHGGKTVVDYGEDGRFACPPHGAKG